jgi:primosomal protein N'
MEIKDIISHTTDIILPKLQRDLISWIAQHFFVLIHTSCNLFFPKNLQEKIKKYTLKYPTEKHTIDLSRNI